MTIKQNNSAISTDGGYEKLKNDIIRAIVDKLQRCKPGTQESEEYIRMLNNLHSAHPDKLLEAMRKKKSVKAALDDSIREEEEGEEEQSEAESEEMQQGQHNEQAEYEAQEQVRVEGLEKLFAAEKKYDETTRYMQSSKESMEKALEKATAAREKFFHAQENLRKKKELYTELSKARGSTEEKWYKSKQTLEKMQEKLTSEYERIESSIQGLMLISSA